MHSLNYRELQFSYFQAAKLELEKYDKDKEELVSKLSDSETMLSDTKRMVLKLQEDNSKLHRAVEQSMTRITRMSLDSDYYVDRFSLYF